MTVHRPDAYASGLIFLVYTYTLSPIHKNMLRNNLFNMMNQLVQESKSVWRIKNQYMQEAVGSDDVMAVWKEIEKTKEEQIVKLQTLIKKYNA